jgi:hypothetical protein
MSQEAQGIKLCADHFMAESMLRHKEILIKLTVHKFLVMFLTRALRHLLHKRADAKLCNPPKEVSTIWQVNATGRKLLPFYNTFHLLQYFYCCRHMNSPEQHVTGNTAAVRRWVDKEWLRVCNHDNSC